MEKGYTIGKTAPDFTLTTLAGETISLSDLRGKKVFLNFWASWCGPCKVEMPEMQEFHEQYGDEVVVLAVNATGDEFSLNNAKDFIEKNELTFPIPLDHELKVVYQYDVVAYPTTYFINREGILQFNRHIGPMDYDMMVEQMKKLD
ncbi:TlpA family protein disulfide reductase [Salirhabdus salicampi]|nr:TlpA family protein disulfide reductase [Salirhabdus salicampi]